MAKGVSALQGLIIAWLAEMVQLCRQEVLGQSKEGSAKNPPRLSIIREGRIERFCYLFLLEEFVNQPGENEQIPSTPAR